MKRKRKRKSNTSQGVFGINANKSRVSSRVKSRSDLSYKVKHVKK